MTSDRWRRGVLSLAVCALAACVDAGASPAPADGGTKKSRTKKKTAAERELEQVLKSADNSDVGGESGELGTISGLGFASAPECMSPADAKKRSQPPKNDPERIGRPGGPAGPSKEFPECVTYIWTWVGAGHSATPVGNVTAPLGVAATRKERTRAKSTCCYMIPPVPGSPNG